MKIPFHRIKEETKRVDEHNKRVEEKIEEHHQSDREAVAKEISSAAGSEGFKKDIRYDKRHPGHLQKVLRKMYGDKAIPR